MSYLYVESPVFEKRTIRELNANIPSIISSEECGLLPLLGFIIYRQIFSYCLTEENKEADFTTVSLHRGGWWVVAVIQECHCRVHLFKYSTFTIATPLSYGSRCYVDKPHVTPSKLPSTSLLYFSVSRRTVIGRFSGPYSPVRPAKI